MLPFPALCLTEIQRALFSYFLGTVFQALKIFVHYWQVLKYSRSHYCLSCHQTRQRCHMNYGINYVAWETLFQQLVKEWNREETADKLTQWAGEKCETPTFEIWLWVLTLQMIALWPWLSYFKLDLSFSTAKWGIAFINIFFKVTRARHSDTGL